MDRQSGRYRFGALVGALAAALLLCLAPGALARDLPSAIATAEGHATTAAGEVEQLKADLAPAEAHLSAARRRAAPVTTRLHIATRHVAALKARDRTSHIVAAARIREIERSNAKALEKHEEKVTSGIGIGLALLLAAGIVLAWGWFRASAAVAALTRLTLAQAIGICVGGGLLAMIVGAVLASGSGVLATLGSLLATLGLLLPVAFLLARHSAEVQRGRATALLRRERLPLRAMQVFAGILAALCLLAFGSALFAPAAKSEDVSAALRAMAAGEGDDAPALAQAEAAALTLKAKARPVLANLHLEEAASAKARRALRRAEARMVGAQRRARSLSHRLVALELHERHLREAEVHREEHELAEEERVLARAEAHEAREAEEAEACDPNYVGACLHDGIGDYDCAGGEGDGPNYVEGPIEVVGTDVFGLDSDNEGIACEEG